MTMDPKTIVAGYLKTAAANEFDEPTVRSKLEASGYEEADVNRFLKAAGERRGTLISIRTVLRLPEDDPRDNIAVRFTKVQRIFEYLS